MRSHQLAGAAAAAAVLLAAWGWARAQSPLRWEVFRSTPAWEAQTAPASHNAAWYRTHGSAGTEDCSTCHTTTWCDDCHAGANPTIAAHAPGFVDVHGAAARAPDAQCATCHTASRSCRSCHLRVGVDSDARPRGAAGSPHPVDYAQPGSSGFHGRDAREDLASCASCHTEDSCAACHAFVNPHGADFRARCRTLASASTGACASCHADLVPPCP